MKVRIQYVKENEAPELCEIEKSSLGSYLHKLSDSLSFEEGAILEQSCNTYEAVVQEKRVTPAHWRYPPSF